MLVLFDLDGTLLDHDAALRSAATALHGLVGSTMPLEEFLARWDEALERHFARYLAGEVSYQGQRRDRVRELVDASLSDEAADRLLTPYLAHYEESWSLYSDALPCLESVAGHRLGVITNGEANQQRSKLVRTGIMGRFECVLISEECGLAKPDATIFLRACSLLGESPENAIHVGDRYDLDAQAARVAGLRGVWLDRKGSATKVHTPPIIDTLDRLRAILAEAE